MAGFEEISIEALFRIDGHVALVTGHTLAIDGGWLEVQRPDSGVFIQISPGRRAFGGSRDVVVRLDKRRHRTPRARRPPLPPDSTTGR